MTNGELYFNTVPLGALMSEYARPLCMIHLNWVNNYASISTFAEHTGLSEGDAQTLIKLARSVYTTPVLDY